MMRRHSIGLVLLAFLSAAGCGEPTIDLEEWIDRRVNDEWMLPGKYVDAAEFFSNGGHYYNHPDIPDETQLDEPHIIPLLTELREKFDLQQYVILEDEPEVAWAVVMRIPDGSNKRSALETYLNEADEKFPGMILQEWGYEWLSLDFLDEEEAAMVREGWGLDEE